MYDVVALGELLIDFASCTGVQTTNPVFEANPGGAPCNVLAMLSNLGFHTAFIGKVGGDMFGAQLRAAAQQAGIDCQGLVADPACNTTLAFVNNKPDGDREFSFFRSPGADTQLTPREVPVAMLQNARLFHFGSLSLTHAPARAATELALQTARQSGAVISFDPNLRPALWDSLEEAKKRIVWGMGQCDVLKLSEEELVFVTGESNLDQAAARVTAQYGNVRLLLVTMGKQGSRAYCGGRTAFCGASAHKAIDTTGAGDTFFACCLGVALTKGVESLTQADLREMLLFANTAAGIITTRKGAMSCMPTRREVAQALQA